VKETERGVEDGDKSLKDTVLGFLITVSEEGLAVFLF